MHLCINFLQEEDKNTDNAMKVVEYMVVWNKFNTETRRQLLVHQWVQVSCLLKGMDGGNNRTYLVPGITVQEGEVSRIICQNGLHRLLNVGRC